MKDWRCYFAVFSILIFAVSLAATERMVVRIDNPNPSLVEEFTRGDYDIAAYRPGEYLDIVVTQEELAELKLMGYEPYITQTQERLENNLQSQRTRIPGYRTYDEVFNELEEIAAVYPHLTRLYNLGDSWGKIYTDDGNDYYENYYHNIWALKLTLEPDSLADKPAVFYFGAHHAREPLSTEVVMDFLNYLLDRYEEDEEINYLVNNTEIWFVPLVNPDGHKVVIDRRDVWWRKNIRDNNENGRFDTQNYFGNGTDGVDLNRNYAFEWRYDSRTFRPTYPGPTAGSEPEVLVLKQLMADVHFVAGITYHTYGEMVLYPYGYATGCRAPDQIALEDLAVKMAETIPKLSGLAHYDPMQSLELYPARGVTDDYAYGVYGAFCFTFELATEFIPDAETVEQVSQDNMEAALILLRRPHHTALTGILTDAVTGEPIAADIYVEGVDNTGSFKHPYSSRDRFGRYYRLLVPGEYKVVITSEEYADTDTLYVTIIEDELTELNIALYPLMTGTITGSVVDFFEKEPIAGSQVQLIGSSLAAVYTDEEGIFILEEVPYRPYEMKISAPDFGTLYRSIIVQESQSNYDFELYPVFFADTFDDLGHWETTGDWGLTTNYSYIGEYSLADSPFGNYGDAMNSYAKLRNRIDLTSAYNASVTFMAQYALEADYDYCYLQVVPENDDEWITIASFTGYTTWEFVDVPLADYCEQFISLRFLFTSDATINEAGIFIDDFRIYISSPELSAEEESIVPPVVNLYQNYPNPFNPETTITFSIPKEQPVKLEVFNIAGQKVKTLINQSLPTGSHQVTWNGLNEQQKSVGSGVFFYRLETGNDTLVRKMVLLK